MFLLIEVLIPSDTSFDERRQAFGDSEGKMKDAEDRRGRTCGCFR